MKTRNSYLTAFIYFSFLFINQSLLQAESFEEAYKRLSLQEQKSYMSSILKEYENFSARYLGNGRNIEEAKQGTPLEKLEADDWSFTKKMIVLHDLPTAKEVQINASTLTLRPNAQEEKIVIDLTLLPLKTLTINGKNLSLSYNLNDPLKDSFKSLKKQLSDFSLKESKKETSWIKTLMDQFMALLPIPQAIFAKSSIGNGFSGIASSIGALFKGSSELREGEVRGPNGEIVRSLAGKNLFNEPYVNESTENNNPHTGSTHKSRSGVNGGYENAWKDTGKVIFRLPNGRRGTDYRKNLLPNATIEGPYREVYQK